MERVRTIMGRLLAELPRDAAEAVAEGMRTHNVDDHGADHGTVVSSPRWANSAPVVVDSRIGRREHVHSTS